MWFHEFNFKSDYSVTRCVKLVQVPLILTMIRDFNLFPNNKTDKAPSVAPCAYIQMVLYYLIRTFLIIKSVPHH